MGWKARPLCEARYRGAQQEGGKEMRGRIHRASFGGPPMPLASAGSSGAESRGQEASLRNV